MFVVEVMRIIIYIRTLGSCSRRTWWRRDWVADRFTSRRCWNK